MWYLFVQISLVLITLWNLLARAEPDYRREAKEQMAATIASARASNLAHPRNTTDLVFGPQLYGTPLLDTYPDLIIPQAFGVSLCPGHSITEHQKVIDRDILPFVRDSFYLRTQDRESAYFVENVDEQLLRAIRSDPKVLFVTSSVRDDNVFE